MLAALLWLGVALSAPAVEASPFAYVTHFFSSDTCQYPKSPSRAVGEDERRTRSPRCVRPHVGCAPLVDVEKVDAATAPKLRTQVPGYEPGDGKTI